MQLVDPREGPLFLLGLILSLVVWAGLTLATFGLVWVYIGLFALIMLFAQAAFVMRVRGDGVEVSAEQFPELHKRLLECSRKCGVKTLPECYVLRTDFFNALATRFLGREIIVLFSDVIDALEDRPGALDFYIGHELGHIHRKHLGWMAWLLPVTWLPLYGAALGRAQERTCDRYGAHCCAGNTDTVAAMAAIAAGNSLWKSLNTRAYLKQVQRTGGFFMSFCELTSTYPWLSKRLAAVLAFKTKAEWQAPRRHPGAWVLACFVPNVGGAGLGGTLVIVAIVGILAAVAVPAYEEYTERASAAAAQARLSALEPQLEQLAEAVFDYTSANEAWPESLDDLGVDAAAVSGADWALTVGPGGTISIDLSDGASGIVDPYIEEGTLVWYCESEALNLDTLSICAD